MASIIISNIAPSTTEETLVDIFKRVDASAVLVYVPTDPLPFASCTYDREKAAERAIMLFDGFPLDGTHLRIVKRHHAPVPSPSKRPRPDEEEDSEELEEGEIRPFKIRRRDVMDLTLGELFSLPPDVRHDVFFNQVYQRVCLSQ